MLIPFNINKGIKLLNLSSSVYHQYDSPSAHNNYINASNNQELLTIDPKNNIYQFLLANIALTRGQSDIAKKHLKELLVITDDPAIAEILTELAIDTEDLELLKTASKNWAELDPNNSSVQLLASIAWLDDESSEIAQKLLQKAILLAPKNINLQLSGLLPNLNTKQTIVLQNTLLKLTNIYPNNPINQLCLAEIAAQLGNIKIARQAIHQALKLQPTLTNAICLQAKLIRYNDKTDTAALNYLKGQIVKFSQNEELLLFYANALADNKQNIESLDVLQKLVNSNNKDIKLEANLLAAEIYLQKPTLNFKQAKSCLKKLVYNNLANNKVYFTLAQINERQANYTEAIRLYTYVTEDPYHTLSFFSAALLLANKNELEKAIAVLNQTNPTSSLEKKQLILFKIQLALELEDLNLAINSVNQGLSTLPNDIELLYARSIIYNLDNQALAAEKDLKLIIKIQPANHKALNALGLMLIEDSTRQLEAFNYLQKALSLSPENPMYMHNMGLLLFYMGKLSDSLAMLNNAYKISNNLNIALRLGEVLWVLGEKKQATSVWKKAWQIDPHDEELISILNKYNVTFLKGRK
jgi:tetratricopeptide (TPR) repeat protein